ncbi:interleukin-22 [Vanacampus margaritifer]
MKAVGTTAFVSLRHLGAGVLTLLLIGCVHQGEAGPVHPTRSSVLRNRDTFLAAKEVSLHAQRSETEDESNIRLNVEANARDHITICCLHANILDFYLNNIFNHVDNQHPKMHQLHSDLSKASDDLQRRGCNVTHYQDHQHAVQFRNKLAMMDSGRALNKALSEVDILFTYLHETC